MVKGAGADVMVVKMLFKAPLLILETICHPEPVEGGGGRIVSNLPIADIDDSRFTKLS